MECGAVCPECKQDRLVGHNWQCFCRKDLGCHHEQVAVSKSCEGGLVVGVCEEGVIADLIKVNRC